MDQLKQQLAGVMKYGFWILCGITAIGALGVGYLSTAALTEERDAQVAKLDADQSAMTTISNEMATHPNDLTKEQMDALIASLKDDVLASWEQQYARQKELLKWPVAELGEDFVEVFEKFEPIETVPFPTEQEVEIGLLTRYRDYIGGVLPDIAEIAGAKWTADFTKSPAGGMGGMSSMGIGGSSSYGTSIGSSSYDLGAGMDSYGGGAAGIGMLGPGGRPLEEPPLVQWDTASQEQLMQNLFPWRGKDPTTLDVLYSQENLWVLTEAMKVIATVNGEAKQPFQATIRKINEIAIGKAASSLAGAAGAMGMGGPGDYSMGSMGDMLMGSGAMGPDGGMATGTVEIPDPADMRYVDKNYEPIEATTLRSAMESSDPEQAYMNVAKRIPIRLNVRMDQRKIPELVAECGNADFMIEVRQVRVNPRAQTGGRMGGMAGLGGMGGGIGMSMPSGMGPASGSAGAEAGASGTAVLQVPVDMGTGLGGYSTMDPGMGTGMGGGQMGTGEFPNDIDVEVSGIVYIYNPPDMDKLGIDKVDENTLVEGDTETVAGEAVETDEVAPPVVTPPVEIDESGEPVLELPVQGAPVEVPAGQVPAGQVPAGQVPAGQGQPAQGQAVPPGVPSNQPQPPQAAPAAGGAGPPALNGDAAAAPQ